MTDNMFMGNETLMVRKDGDRLVSVYPPNQPQLVGYTVDAYNSLKAEADEATGLLESYRKILVDNGLLEEEKSTEEQLSDINNKFDKMFNLFDSFNARIENFEKRLNVIEVRNGHPENPSGSGKNNRTKPESS